ncbi:unnamed protein product, partial [Effrenium voratum]
ELATFSRHGGAEKVELLPLWLAPWLLFSILSDLLSATIFEVLEHVFPNWSVAWMDGIIGMAERVLGHNPAMLKFVVWFVIWMISSIVYLPASIPSFFSFRMKLRNHQLLLDQMAGFDVRKAKCTVPTDREAIEQQVKELFKEAAGEGSGAEPNGDAEQPGDQKRFQDARTSYSKRSMQAKAREATRSIGQCLGCRLKVWTRERTPALDWTPCFLICASFGKKLLPFESTFGSFATAPDEVSLDNRLNRLWRMDPLDSFNAYIRGALRENVITQIGKELYVPWRTCLTAFLPMIFYSLVNVLGCDNGPCETSFKLAGFSRLITLELPRLVESVLGLMTCFFFFAGSMKHTGC